MILKVTKTTKVSGDIYISGSKNAALPCICAALLTKRSVRLKNVPDIEDVNNLLLIIKSLGVKVKKSEKEIIIQAKKIKQNVPNELVEKLRGSYYLMGAVLSRYSKLRIRYPGGCDLGGRPIDYHLNSFEQLWFEVIKDNKFIEINEKQRTSAKITFPSISLGATINVLLLSSKIIGETIITNPSLEPEVICVIDMLKQMGANIMIKEKQIIINGVERLDGVTHHIIYDRIEAGSYLFLVGSIPNSKVTIHNVEPKDLELVILPARNMGIKVEKQEDKIIVEGTKRIKKTNILIGPYPFFPTDLQQIITVVLTKAKGTSIIEDQIFPSRIAHLKELRKMGAYVYDYNRCIYIKESTLKSSKVVASDLRCAFALIVAGTMASGTTYIKNIDYLFRGYVDPVDKLRRIGINVELI